MNTRRRTLLLSLAAGGALAACGGGSDGGTPGGGGGLGSQDKVAIAAFTPSSVPASSPLPITFEVNFTYDLETTSPATLGVGYQLGTGGAVIAATQAVTSKGPGSGALTFSLPAAAVGTASIAVVVRLSSGTTVLAQAVATVARSG